MASEQTQEYDDALVAVLEAVWGEGYLSPGGPDEIRMIVEGVALRGKDLLDLGCGTGGITRFLAETYSPARIVGIDVDAGLIARATERATRAGLGSSLTFQTVTPGPLPLPTAASTSCSARMRWCTSPTRSRCLRRSSACCGQAASSRPATG